MFLIACSDVPPCNLETFPIVAIEKSGLFQLRAGAALADSGYNIQHIPTAAQLGIQNTRTSDLLVEGLGRLMSLLLSQITRVV